LIAISRSKAVDDYGLRPDGLNWRGEEESKHGQPSATFS
jgi:hypothetical protein